MPSTEPVTYAGAITTIVETGLLMLISMGVIDITDDQVGQIMAFVIAVLGVVGPLYFARRASTPLAAPRDLDGVGLVRPGNEPPIEVARSMREG